MKAWVQEPLWVRRDDNGVIVQIADKLPDGAEFIPTVRIDAENEKSATGQGN